MVTGAVLLVAASFDSPVMFWQHVVLFALNTLASEG